jgi:phosphate transport system permease protein
MLARAATILAWASATVVLFTTAALVGVLVWRGVGAIDTAFLFGDTPPLEAMRGRAPVFGGIWPALCGTLMLIATASLLAIPLGVASGIFLFEYATPRQRAGIGFLVDLLAGVPSVVMGLFGFTIILLLRQTLAPDAHQCLLLAATCLAVLVLPYLIRTTQQALAALPESTRLLGPALGLSRWQNLHLLLLPAARSGVWSGTALAIGRIAEDTAVIMLTGAVFNTGLPGGPFDRFEALPYRIYWLGAQYRNAGELQQGFGCALTLLLLTAAMFGIALLLRRRMERTWAP